MDIKHVREHHVIEYRGQSVSVGIIETGEWVALRSITPMFCMAGATSDEAEEKARGAIDFWMTERFPGMFDKVE